MRSLVLDSIDGVEGRVIAVPSNLTLVAKHNKMQRLRADNAAVSDTEVAISGDDRGNERCREDLFGLMFEKVTWDPDLAGKVIHIGQDLS
eukprot:CAMPEP_0184504766 /NCGR_PEP_ID=MMETSP0113_2-20130426/52634_1 /TAXON_ID=91329 /ORGANISM="Norrisiella sphaerica, Strain BC52" /LENGTH=89 /DNA_ID=CAMNT_0026894423 /DNA_START=225 /DNA_END=494 /DNA_ORIENTATION=+